MCTGTPSQAETTEVEDGTKGIQMPYRTAIVPHAAQRPSWVARGWYRWIGKLVYGGEESCGHCKFWKPPKKLRDWYWDTDENGRRGKVWYDVKGDCKLLFGEEDTTQHHRCDRFRPRRRYMHREKIG